MLARDETQWWMKDQEETAWRSECWDHSIDSHEHTGELSGHARAESVYVRLRMVTSFAWSRAVSLAKGM